MDISLIGVYETQSSIAKTLFHWGITSRAMEVSFSNVLSRLKNLFSRAFDDSPRTIKLTCRSFAKVAIVLEMSSALSMVISAS